jgi:glycosyltransferase involved in cell wall biosynthesis
MIHYDPRWSGAHGIGRFADEVIPRLGDTHALEPGVPKLSLLDPVATMLALAKLRTGIYFSPGFNGPLRCPVPFAFCIYDLIHLRFPGESSWLRSAYYRHVVLPASRKAFTIFTISEHSLQTILEWSRLPRERLCVAGCGVAAAFTAAGPVHRPGYPYFLYVGRRDPHKNIARLLDAYGASRSRSDVRLVLSGAPEQGTQRLVHDRGLSSDVVFSGPLHDDELAAYYRGAVALAFPSLYEGFGLPIAEAMACGTPVLTSNLTAMPETAGDDNAMLVDPLRAEAITEGMDRLAQDSGLRAALSARGIARARQFSWDEVGRRVREGLEAGQP